MLAPLPLPNVVGCRAVDPKCCAEYRKRRWRKAGRNPITPASQLTQEAQERQMAGYAPDWAQTTAEALGYY